MAHIVLPTTNDCSALSKFKFVRLHFSIPKKPRRSKCLQGPKNGLKLTPTVLNYLKGTGKTDCSCPVHSARFVVDPQDDLRRPQETAVV